MATTYMTLVNLALGRLNETLLTSASFSSPVGPQLAMQTAVNAAISDICRRYQLWPFNYGKQTFTTQASTATTSGTGAIYNEYTPPATVTSIKWNTFGIHCDKLYASSSVYFQALEECLMRVTGITKLPVKGWHQALIPIGELPIRGVPFIPPDHPNQRIYDLPEGLSVLSYDHEHSGSLYTGLKRLGYSISSEHFFDTLRVELGTGNLEAIIAAATARNINLRIFDDTAVGIDR